MSEWYEEEGTLYTFLQDHPSIWFVHLVWTWNKTIDIETPYRVKYSNGQTGEVVARYHGNPVDEEYTFIGPREEALAFAKAYDCWDGSFDDPENGMIKDGILFMDRDSYDPDADEFPGGADELETDFTYSGLYFYHPAGPYGHDGSMAPVRSYVRSGLIELIKDD